MKARVKATGEIGIVANIDLLFGNKGYRYQSDEVEIIDSYADIETAKDPDYWEKLKHQFAGMAMQGILSNQDYCKLLIDENQTGSFADDVSRCAKAFATVLVEKLKNE